MHITLILNLTLTLYHTFPTFNNLLLGKKLLKTFQEKEISEYESCLVSTPQSLLSLEMSQQIYCVVKG